MSEEFETTPDADEDRDVSTPENDDDDEGRDVNDDTDEGLDDEDPDSGDDDDDEGLVDFEFEGKTYRVPEALKKGVLREADYTRKTQEVAELRKEAQARTEQVQAREAEVEKHLVTAKEISEERAQLQAVRLQIKAMNGLDWDKLEQEDPEDANRLFRQRVKLREAEVDLSAALKEKETNLDLERQRSAKAARATAIQDVEAALKRDIKGWNNDLATKVGEFAVTSLGWRPQQVIDLLDPTIIRTLHAAYVGDQARKRLSTQRKLDAGDKAAPVGRPAGGAGAPNARRTTDATGDRLSTAEWIRREAQRQDAKRSKGR